MHWFLAIRFVILALSGLFLLFGRWLLIPVLGPEGFSIIALVSRSLHNYVGLFLDFPNFQQSRERLQSAHIIHTIV